MDVQRLPPYDLADHDLSNENTLLLGAPCIGQTRQLDAHPGITVVETLEAAPGVPDDDLLCIDDFYDAYQSADDASRARLPDLLDRPGGVYLSTRPRALDWLLSEGDLGASDDDGAAFLDAFDRVLLLVVDPDADRDRAREWAADLADVDPDALDEYLDELQYPGYEFSADELRSTMREYEPTLLPPAATLVSGGLAAGSTAVSVSAARDMLSRFGLEVTSGVGVSTLYDSFKEAVPSILEGVGGLSVGSAATVASAAAPPVVAAGAVLVCNVLGREDDLAPNEVFSKLLSKELLPHTEAKVEEWLDLPPRTIANFRSLADQLDPETWEALQEQVRDHERRLGDLSGRVATLESRLDGLARSYHGFVEVDAVYTDLRSPPSFEEGLRTGFGPAAACAGQVLDRERPPTPSAETGSPATGSASRRRPGQPALDAPDRPAEEGRTSVTEALEAGLRDGTDHIVLGPPGSGKSAICLAVLARWRAADHGPVFYRESSQRGFERPAVLAEELRRARSKGHVLVIVEDAARESTRAAYELLREFEGDLSVSFLFDARTGEFNGFDVAPADTGDAAALRAARDRLVTVDVPPVDRPECARLLDHAATHADALDTDIDPGTLYEATVSGPSATGPMLRIAHRLLPADGGRTGLESDVLGKFRTLEDPMPAASDRASKLDAQDDELRRHAAMLLQLLNATPTVQVHRGYLYGFVETLSVDRRAVDELLESLSGWLVFRRDGRLRTMHERWAFLFLRHALEGDPTRGDEQEPPLAGAVTWQDNDRLVHRRFARCVETVLAVLDADDEGALGWTPANDLRRRLDGPPGDLADEFLTGLFELGRTHPVLGPMFQPEGRSLVDYREGDLTSPTTVARGLVAVGRMHRKQQNPDLARDALERAANRIEDLEGPAVTRLRVRRLNELGALERQAGAYDAAARHHREALDLATEAGAHALEIDSRNYLSVIPRERGEGDAARTHNEAALERARAIGDRRRQAESLTNLAMVGTPDRDSRDLLEEALSIARADGYRKEAASAYFTLAVRHEADGASEAAADAFREALHRYRELGDAERVGWCQYRLGQLAQRSSSVDGIDPDHRFEAALEAFERIDFRPGLAHTQFAIARRAERAGDASAAADWYAAAAEAIADVDNPEQELRIRRRRADLAIRRGAGELAIEEYQRARGVADRLGDRERLARAERKLARAYRLADAPRRATRHVERAVAAAEAGDAPGQLGRARIEAGKLAERRADLETADERYAAAIDPLTRSDDWGQVANCHLWRARIARQRGDIDAAIEHAEEEVAVSFDHFDADRTFDSLSDLVGLELAHGRADRAADRLERATERFADEGAAHVALDALELFVAAAVAAGSHERATVVASHLLRAGADIADMVRRDQGFDAGGNRVGPD